jgi:Family of unknown function (DUF6325)
MAAETFGPVELFVIAFPQERIPESFRSSVLGVLAGGAVTLLDLTVIHHTDAGLEVLELEMVGDEVDLTSVELPAQGLIGDEDLESLADGLAIGTTALVLAIEHTWARSVVAAVQESGAQVIATERIPADVVNQVVALAQSDDEPA